MKLLKMLKEGDEVKQMWSKSIDVNNEDIHLYSEANLRHSYNDEIIFDAESKVEALLVRMELIKNNISFTEWDTGSRGHHFHTRWKGLDTLSKNDREIYRWIIINKDSYLSSLFKSCKNRSNLKPYLYALRELKYVETYNTDVCMKNDTHWIALENRPHLKSGKYKKLVKSYIPQTIYNKLDMELVTIIRNIYIGVTSNNKVKTNFSDNSDINDIKRKIKVSDLFKKWGHYNHKGNRHNPFWRSSSGKKGVQINDANNNCFDYGEYKAYDLFSLVMMKNNCSFSESIELLKNGSY